MMKNILFHYCMIIEFFSLKRKKRKKKKKKKKKKGRGMEWWSHKTQMGNIGHGVWWRGKPHKRMGGGTQIPYPRFCPNLNDGNNGKHSSQDLLNQVRYGSRVWCTRYLCGSLRIVVATSALQSWHSKPILFVVCL